VHARSLEHAHAPPLGPPVAHAPSQLLAVDNVEDVFALSEALSAPQLAHRCALFALENQQELSERLRGGGYAKLMRVRGEV
jgi:hypothetical protein